MEKQNVRMLTETVIDFISNLEKDFGVSVSRKGKMIIINNIKGGVGKSAIAKTLARFLELCNFRVLLIDADSSGNSSSLFVPEENQDESNKFSNIYEGKTVRPYSVSENLDVLVGSNELWNVETLLSIKSANVKLFRSWIFKNNIRDFYDFIIVDTHNGKGQLNKSIYYATNDDLVLGVSEPSIDSYGGLIKLQDYLEEIKNEYTDEETGYCPLKYNFGFIANKVPNVGKTSKEFMSVATNDNGYIGAIQDRNIFDDAAALRKTIFDLTEESYYNRLDMNFKPFFLHTLEVLKSIVDQAVV
ncbi:TPA: ParA family protein [Streptococcus agalactiae]|nr:ParA family protein [Streptococcus agalactiae]HEO2267384.1 ParA family protein [Streptococcus agalactiae]HEO7770442.1 ParA family protein [Streptococcus agalactiae]